MWLRFMGGPVKNKKKTERWKVKQKKRSVKRNLPVNVLLWNLVWSSDTLTTCSKDPDNVFWKTLDMLVNDQLDDSYTAQHWR